MIQNLHNQIIFLIHTLSTHINSINRFWYTDINRDFQNLYCELAKELWGWNLVNLDLENNKGNFSDIDLSDLKKNIYVQVTSDTSSTKIKKTLEASKGKYKEISIWFIGKRKTYNKTTFNKYIGFDIKNNIIDDITLTNEIFKINDIQKLLRIYDIFNKYKPNINDNKHTTDDFREWLIYIKKKLWIKNIDIKKQLIPNKERTINKLFMFEKDLLNNMSEENYKNSLIYNQPLLKLLEDDEHRSLYNNICTTIKNKLGGESIANIFNRLILPINSYEENRLRNSIIILLENMYFNCDIWNNPDDYTG